jgi:uncharacterized protein (DUF885 family)
MSDTTTSSRPSRPQPRAIADGYVTAYAALDPTVATYIGLEGGHDRLPDFSPAGLEAVADLARSTLRELAGTEAADAAERRCARLLRERLTAELAVHEAGEGLRAVGTLKSPVHAVRSAFTMMPTGTDEEWATLAARLRAVPETLAGYRSSLQLGLERGLRGGPRQVEVMVEQLASWVGQEPGGDGRGWFAGLVAEGPDGLRAELDSAARTATGAVAELRSWLRDHYAAAVRDAPDPVGRERYARWSRQWTGSELDLDEAYAWGWEEFHRLDAEMRVEAGRVLPGAEPLAAMAHLNESGEIVEGADAIRDWLQALMEEAVEALDGIHVDLAAPLRRVEARIAPPGSAAAPYYTAPSLDFSRPGRTWLPTLGRERFPVWDLVSMWYHEGVPGHHLQLGQWVLVADRLSQYQTSVGGVSANLEGWALYAERLMDELGFLTDPGRRLGYLNAQMLRAIRVVLDIGMHLEMPIPAHSPFRPGERWTPELARDFFGRFNGLPPAMLDSEVVRYLGIPGQAIGYKLGERAWLAGREAARTTRGAAFDLKSWHMAALSLGSLGLDDLVDELSAL